MAVNLDSESEKTFNLKGSPQNPATEPRISAKGGKKDRGMVALNDALIIVGAAWFLLIILAFSLRHHNN